MPPFLPLWDVHSPSSPLSFLCYFLLYAFTSQTTSLHYVSSYSPSIFPCLFSPPCLAHTACFLSHRCHHQSHSLIASVWCCCGWEGGQAAAGEGTGGTDCHHPPGAEVIFSSRSGSRHLHPCNPVSRPEDSKSTDYVD